MNLSRRGFLGTLLGAIAAEELWVPGKKLISIAKHVHVPEWIHLRVDFPNGDFHRDMEILDRLYIVPAAAALVGLIEKRWREAGGPPPSYESLELPRGVDLALRVPLRMPLIMDGGGFDRSPTDWPEFPEARLVRGYDPVHRCYRTCMDAKVRI